MESAAVPAEFYIAPGLTLEALLDGAWTPVVVLRAPGDTIGEWRVCPASSSGVGDSEGRREGQEVSEAEALRVVKEERERWIEWLKSEGLAGRGHDPARHGADTLRRFCASARQGWGRAVHFTQLRPLSQPRPAPTPGPQPSPAPAPEPEPVLRVLALHGGYQNAAVFDTVRTKDFQRRLAAVAEFTCLDAPILATRSDDQLRERRSWFNWDEKDPEVFEWAIAQEEIVYHRLQEMLDYLESAWTERGPFGGVLGFSQGAIAASVWMEWRRRSKRLGAAAAEKPAVHADSPRFFIAIGGMVAPRPKNLAGYGLSPFADPPPSLHIMGAKDEMIQPGEGKRLAALFAGGEEWTHSGKHFVPQNTAACKRVAEFLARCLG